MKKQNSTRGNALFMILIAIVLLGGLTVLLTRTGSQTDETGSTEQASIKASNILKYFTGIEFTIQRLMLQGCSQSQISFYDAAEPNAYYRTEYAHALAPTDKSCHVFDPAGGGVTYKSNGLLGGTDIRFTGRGSIMSWNVGAAYSTDLIVTLANIPLSTCIAFNKLVGMPMVSSTPPGLDYGYDAPPFAGVYAPTAGSVAVTGLTGKKAGCVIGKDTGLLPAGTYSIYYGLLKR